MALTSTEEAQLRDLLTKKSSLDSLAANESEITANLGASSATLSDLGAATALDDADLMLIRQAVTDKSVTISTLYNKFFGASLLNLDVSSGNVTLTSEQAKARVINLIGTLTANRQVTFPNTVNQWIIKNNTSGNFSVELKPASASGVLSYAGQSVTIYGDGNVIANADSSKDGLTSGAVLTVTSTQTLAQSTLGSTVRISGNTAAITLTLPTPVVGERIEIVNNSTYNCAIQRQGSNTITYLDGQTATSNPLNAGSRIVLLGQSSTNWLAVGGTAEHGATFGNSGWQRLPSGFILQWGQVVQVAGSQTYALPRTFPVQAFGAIACKGQLLQTSGEFAVGAGVTLSNITITNTNSNGATSQGIFWIALGY